MAKREVSELYTSLRILVTVTAVVVLSITAITLFWKFYPYPETVTYPKPYRIVYPQNKVVAQGDVLTYEFYYNKPNNIIPTVRRQFVDGLIFNIANNDPTLIAKGRGKARVQIYIPETLPPGRYHISISAAYKLNPIRTVYNNSTTEHFTVIAAKHDDADWDDLGED